MSSKKIQEKMSSKRSDITDEEWKWQRREAIIRDDYECQECGAIGGHKGSVSLVAHHIQPVSEGGGDELENLQTLCEACHKDRHRTEKGSNTGTRALLTDTDRQYITGEEGKEKRYQSASRVRRRIQEELPRDIEILEENHPELLEELREVVCTDD